MSAKIGSGNDYWCRSGGGSGNRHSGGGGRRGRNAHAKIAKILVEQAMAYTIVLFCNDQAGCKGTGNRGKYDSDQHTLRRNAR